MVAPIITSPKPQTILTVNIAYTVIVYAPNDNTLGIYNGSTFIGYATKYDANYWHYSWTPSVTTSSGSLSAIGDVSGTSTIVVVTVAETNAVNTNISAWTKTYTGGTITNGIDDPFGGNTAYRISLPTTTNASCAVYNTASAVPTIALVGMEMWCRPYGGLNFIYVASAGGASKGIYFDVTTGEAKSTALYGTIVEYGINGWVRVQIARAAETYTSQTFYWYLCQSITSINLNITSGQAAAGIGMDFCAPRWVGTVSLPLTIQQQLAARYDSITGIVRQNYYKHPYIDTATNMVGIGDASYTPYGMTFSVIRPTAWSANNKYPVLWILPALLPSQDAALGADNAVQAASGRNYADLYNIVVIVIYDRSGEFWYGKFSDGTHNKHDFVAQVAWQYAVDHHAASTNPENHTLCGYSKSGWGACQLMMRNRNRFGRCVVWDAPWSTTYAYSDVSANFDSNAQFQLFNPINILSTYASQLQDKVRIILYKGVAWNSDFDAMVAALTAANIPFYSDTSQQISPHEWGTNTWLPVVIAKAMQYAQTSSTQIIYNSENPLEYISS